MSQSETDTIEVRLSDVSGLFDPFDPLPPKRRDLSPSAEAFIVDWASEFSKQAALTIRVHANLPTEEAGAAEIEEAMRRHFQARARQLSVERHAVVAGGRSAILLSVSLLIVCVGLRYFINARLGPTPFTDFLAELLLLLGTVANWRPLELLLYEWRPLEQRRRLYERLSRARIEFCKDRSLESGSTVSSGPVLEPSNKLMSLGS